MVRLVEARSKTSRSTCRHVHRSERGDCPRNEDYNRLLSLSFNEVVDKVSAWLDRANVACIEMCGASLLDVGNKVARL
jgi:hypothetical protein